MWIKTVVVWFIAMDLLIPGFTWGYWLQACLAVLIQGGLILLTEGSTHRVGSVASTQLTSFSAHQRRVKFFLTTSTDAYNLITIYEACPIQGALMGTLARYSRKILQKLDQKRWHLIIKSAPSSSVLSQCSDHVGNHRLLRMHRCTICLQRKHANIFITKWTTESNHAASS